MQDNKITYTPHPGASNAAIGRSEARENADGAAIHRTQERKVNV